MALESRSARIGEHHPTLLLPFRSSNGSNRQADRQTELTITAAENALRTVLLQKRCLTCPQQTPSCIKCASDEVCSQVPSTCDVCAHTVCVKSSVATNTGVTSTKHSGPNAGAIAGGVIGGIVVIALATFLVYWFFIRNKRRQQYNQEEWEEQEWEAGEKHRSQFTMQRDARASTHTVHSMASTVLTRASNIIQIAYIPGVTNRSGPGSPGLLVPPVPPIPIPTSPNSQPGTPFSQAHPDALFFDANDIRDSTYSGLTSLDGRSSYARTSIAPSISPSLARASVATTIFRGNAVASPVPTQTIVRGKAAVVSVKSNSSGSPSLTPEAETPPVPQIDYAKHAADKRAPRAVVPGQGHIGAQVVRPTLVRVPSSANSSTRGNGKPVALNISKKGKNSTADSSAASSPAPESDVSSPKGLGLNRLTDLSLADSTKTHERSRLSPVRSRHADSSDDETTDGEDHVRSRRSLLARKNNDDSPSVGPSPFADVHRV